MRRPYTARMYRRLVERLAAEVPGLGLGTDLIVGHPGETDADFAETVDLVRALPLSYLHVFSYSDRRGTESARLGGRVASRTISERGRRLRDLGADKSLAFRRGLVGRTHEVLVLDRRDRDTGLRAGLTANYVEVLFADDGGPAGRFVRVAVAEASAERTVGVLADAQAGGGAEGVA
jgi:threonylcarbamoyladenosine tRNA methylthiotransferase MtaB